MKQAKTGRTARRLAIALLPAIVVAVAVLAFRADPTSGRSASPADIASGGLVDRGGPDGQVAPEGDRGDRPAGPAAEVGPPPSVGEAQPISGDTAMAFGIPPAESQEVVEAAIEQAAPRGETPIDPLDRLAAEPAGTASQQEDLAVSGGEAPLAGALQRSFPGVTYTGWIPPDDQIAAGPNHLVIPLNGAVAYFDKGGNNLFQTTLTSFFGGLADPVSSVFDPRIIWDHDSGRFILIAVGRNTTTQVSRYFIAVSATANPFDGWCRGSIDAAFGDPNVWADYPDLGVGPNGGLYITSNRFTWAGAFAGALLLTLDKSGMTGCTGLGGYWNGGFTDGDGGASFTLRPAVDYDPAHDSQAEWVVNSNSSNANWLSIWRVINNMPAAPTITMQTLIVGAYQTPPNARQPGGVQSLDNIGTRLLNAVSRWDWVWTVGTTECNRGGGPTESCLRWYQLDLFNWPTMLINHQGEFGLTNLDYFYPGITANDTNDVVIVFAASGPSRYAEARHTARLSTDGLNLLQGSALLKAGEASYLRLDTLGRNRWGDYAGISYGANDEFWILHQYADDPYSPPGDPGHWDTWVGCIGLGGSQCATLTPTPTPVTPTATNTPVTPTATNTPVTPTNTPTPKPVVKAECTHQTIVGKPTEFRLICHLSDPDFDGKIFDWEILLDDQVPPWPRPDGWECTAEEGVIPWTPDSDIAGNPRCKDETGKNPWLVPQCRDMHVLFPAGLEVGPEVQIHLTDIEHQNIGIMWSYADPLPPKLCRPTPTPTKTATPTHTNTPTATATWTPTPTEGPPALQDPTFSISRNSPSAPVPVDPADLLLRQPGGAPPPNVVYPCPAFALIVCGGADEVNAVSLGQDFTLPPPDPANPDAYLYFSVAPGAIGAAGTGVNAETVGPACLPEPEADEFGSAALGGNYQFMDGDGFAACANPPAPALGLIEGIPGIPSDDLDALDPLNFVATGPPIFVSLDQQSPSLQGFGGSAADIYVDFGLGITAWYAMPAQLGLDRFGMNTDDIDALCIRNNGDGEYDPLVDTVWFSLAAGSASLGIAGDSPADVFAAPFTPGAPVVTAGQLGLFGAPPGAGGDELNALKCYEEPPPPVCIDRDGDTACRDPINDSDDDGCTDAQEAVLGTDPNAWYDVFDVPAPTNADPTPNGLRSREVSMGDVVSVFFYAFADAGGPPNGNGVSYDSTKGMSSPHTDPPQNLVVGMMYDRSAGDPDPDGAGPFIDPAGPPNGVIDIGDALIALAQSFAVDCTGP